MVTKRDYTRNEDIDTYFNLRLEGPYNTVSLEYDAFLD